MLLLKLLLPPPLLRSLLLRERGVRLRRKKRLRLLLSPFSPILMLLVLLVALLSLLVPPLTSLPRLTPLSQQLLVPMLDPLLVLDSPLLVLMPNFPLLGLP